MVYSRITITGHKGILGSQFKQLLEDQANCQLIDLPEFDITDRNRLQAELSDFAPELVLHCAAYTAVDKAESESEIAFRVNALATGWLAEICARIKARLVYFSTDYVFCDAKGAIPYREFDITAPRGVYAQSKYAGEELIRLHHPQHFIIRTSWLYGPQGKNFVDTILQSGRTNSELKVVNDQVGSPTYSEDLALMVLKVLSSCPFGTYHITNKGSCSWYQFALEIVKLAGLNCRVYPISTAEFNAPAPRPQYSVLDHFALRNTIGDDMPFWRDSLRRYILTGH
jgi:dTDP-4-dehydrorhamnose reductase